MASDQVRIPGREVLLTQAKARPLLAERIAMTVKEGEVVLQMLPDVCDDQCLRMGDTLGNFGIWVVQPHMTAANAQRRGVAVEHN